MSMALLQMWLQGFDKTACRGAQLQLGQLKLAAQAAIEEVGVQEEVQRELRRKLIRVKADRALV